MVTQNLLEKYIMQVNNRNISLICLTFFKLAIKTPNTVWKVSKYVVFSGPYFLVFGLNAGKYGPGKAPYMDTYHALTFS